MRVGEAGRQAGELERQASKHTYHGDQLLADERLFLGPRVQAVPPLAAGLLVVEDVQAVDPEPGGRKESTFPLHAVQVQRADLRPLNNQGKGRELRQLTGTSKEAVNAAVLPFCRAAALTLSYTMAAGARLKWVTMSSNAMRGPSCRVRMVKAMQMP